MENLLTVFFFGSFATVVYILARALPRVPDEELGATKAKNFLSNIPAHKIDLAIASFLEKVLRRSRVVVLRVDNAINNSLGKIKKNGNGKQKSLFGPTENEDNNKTTDA